MILILTDSLRQATPVTFATDVELLGLADEDFVYSADMQALFSLNTTAAFIWSVADLLRGGIVLERPLAGQCAHEEAAQKGGKAGPAWDNQENREA